MIHGACTCACMHMHTLLSYRYIPDTHFFINANMTFTTSLMYTGQRYSSWKNSTSSPRARTLSIHYNIETKACLKEIIMQQLLFWREIILQQLVLSSIINPRMLNIEKNNLLKTSKGKESHSFSNRQWT